MIVNWIKLCTYIDGIHKCLFVFEQSCLSRASFNLLNTPQCTAKEPSSSRDSRAQSGSRKLNKSDGATTSPWRMISSESVKSALASQSNHGALIYILNACLTSDNLISIPSPNRVTYHLFFWFSLNFFFAIGAPGVLTCDRKSHAPQREHRSSRIEINLDFLNSLQNSCSPSSLLALLVDPPQIFVNYFLPWSAHLCLIHYQSETLTNTLTTGRRRIVNISAADIIITNSSSQ